MSICKIPFSFRTPVKPPPTVNVQPAQDHDDSTEDLDMSAAERPKSKRSVSPRHVDPDERYPSFHSPKPDKTVRARSKSKSPLVPAETAAVPKRNLIPSGRQIERTPQVEPAKQPKVPMENDADAGISKQSPDASRNLSRVSEADEDGNVEATPALESKKNVIPLGAQIPR